jgi:hypothetical protein
MLDTCACQSPELLRATSARAFGLFSLGHGTRCPAPMLGDMSSHRRSPDFKLPSSMEILLLNARLSAPYADIIAFNHTDSYFEFVVFGLIPQTV